MTAVAKKIEKAEEEVKDKMVPSAGTNGKVNRKVVDKVLLKISQSKVEIKSKICNSKDDTKISNHKSIAFFRKELMKTGRLKGVLNNFKKWKYA